MEIIAPKYYHSFQCVASACPDSCCHAWAVQIDDDSAAFYRTLPGGLGDTLRTHLQDSPDGTILSLTDDGRCPMWRQDGLCQLQHDLGEQALCSVCREFPRLRHDYGSFVELGLELSCPEAAKMILSCNRHETVSQTVPGDGSPDYDAFAMDILLRTRKQLLAFLDSRSYPLGETLAIMLLYGYCVQNELDGGEEALLMPEKSLAEAISLSMPGDMAAIIQFFAGLEILTDSWRAHLAAPAGSDWSESLRAMARYGIQRYYLQAVSDYDLVGRIKLIIISCLLVKALGGNVVETAQLYSKEIENDADNIDAILDGAYASPALTDRNLLGLLLDVSVS